MHFCYHKQETTVYYPLPHRTGNVSSILELNMKILRKIRDDALKSPYEVIGTLCKQCETKREKRSGEKVSIAVTLNIKEFKHRRASL